MMNVEDASLQKQFEFLLELDRLKTIVRQSHIVSGSRRENSAEHSWHGKQRASLSHIISQHAREYNDRVRSLRQLRINFQLGTNTILPASRDAASAKAASKS